MTCKLNLLWKVVLSVILLLTLSCQPTMRIKTKYHGDYPTNDLRSMWAFCFQNFKLKVPYAHPDQIGTICDCYVDEMRMSHPQKDINNLNDNESREMGYRLIRVCNPKTESISI